MEENKKKIQNYKYFIESFNQSNIKMMNNFLHKYNYGILIEDQYESKYITLLNNISSEAIIIGKNLNNNRVYCCDCKFNPAGLINDIEQLINTFFNKIPNCFKQLIIMTVKK